MFAMFHRDGNAQSGAGMGFAILTPFGPLLVAGPRKMCHFLYYNVTITKPGGGPMLGWYQHDGRSPVWCTLYYAH